MKRPHIEPDEPEKSSRGSSASSGRSHASRNSWFTRDENAELFLRTPLILTHVSARPPADGAAVCRVCMGAAELVSS